MTGFASLFTLAVAASTAHAAFQGFNYGNTFTDGRIKTQTDFENEFRTAAGLDGTKGAFTSARLYTMIQGGTTNEPIAAIPAAINTHTTLLLGLWASAGPDAFNNELEALRKAINTHGAEFAKLVAGISVGSEDLYRITPTAISNGEFVGVGPSVLANYIGQVRNVIQGTVLSGAKIGHVDTWTAYTNSSNKALIDACDWIGMDAYPYFQKSMANNIGNGRRLFADALGATKAAVGGKEVWITETGWPVSGKNFGDAVPSLENAKNFWQQVGCPMFGKTNVWWYTFQDSAPSTPNPSFGVIGSELTTKPLYDLSCEGVEIPEDTPSPSGSSDSGAQPTGKPSSGPDTSPGSGSDSGSGQGSGSPSGTGPGSGPGSDPAAPPNAASRLSSFGAVVVAVVAAVALS